MLPNSFFVKEDMWLRVGGEEGVWREFDAIKGGSNARHDTLPRVWLFL